MAERRKTGRTILNNKTINYVDLREEPVDILGNIRLYDGYKECVFIITHKQLRFYEDRIQFNRPDIYEEMKSRHINLEVYKTRLPVWRA